MAQKGGTTSAAKSSRDTREDRLKAALKANLQKRKAQARARADDEGKKPRNNEAD